MEDITILDTNQLLCQEEKITWATFYESGIHQTINYRWSYYFPLIHFDGSNDIRKKVGRDLVNKKGKIEIVEIVSKNELDREEIIRLLTLGEYENVNFYEVYFPRGWFTRKNMIIGDGVIGFNVKNYIQNFQNKEKIKKVLIPGNWNVLVNCIGHNWANKLI